MRDPVKTISLNVDLRTKLALELIADGTGTTLTKATERVLQLGLEVFQMKRPRLELGGPVLLVGEAPNRAVAARPSLWLFPDGPPNASGPLMLRHSGLSKQEYLALFERTNLFDRALGPNEWPWREALRRADRMRRFLGGRTVVVLGRRVARAFCERAYSAPWFSWFDQPAADGVFELAVCPHPSGRSFVWHDPRWRGAAQAFFRRLADERLEAVVRGPGEPWPTAPPEGPSSSPALPDAPGDDAQPAAVRA